MLQPHFAIKEPPLQLLRPSDPLQMDTAMQYPSLDWWTCSQCSSCTVQLGQGSIFCISVKSPSSNYTVKTHDKDATLPLMGSWGTMERQPRTLAVYNRQIAFWVCNCFQPSSRTANDRTAPWPTTSQLFVWSFPSIGRHPKWIEMDALWWLTAHSSWVQLLDWIILDCFLPGLNLPFKAFCNLHAFVHL